VDTAETAADSGRIAGERVDKRLAKRYKRQVSRAREKVRLSEHDVRTPEQVEAARQASRAYFRRDKNPWPYNLAVLASLNNLIARCEPRLAVAGCRPQSADRYVLLRTDFR
jgi:hypothetical protein